MTDAALLSLERDVFLRVFASDAKVSEFVFMEMKALAKKIATKQAIPVGLPENLLTIVARVLAADEAPIDQLVQRGVFSLSRLLVMCSVYAESNVQAMQWVVERLFARAPRLKEQVPMLHAVFYQALAELHGRVNTLKDADEAATELLEQLQDIAQSVEALGACSPTFLDVLTPPGQPLAQAFDGNTLLHALLVAYECDLPMLEQMNGDTHSVRMLVGKTRHHLVTLLDHWLEHHVLSVLRSRSPQADEACETLFSLLDVLLHGNAAPAIVTQHGSLLSDYNQCFDLTRNCASVFAAAGIDSTRAEYLGMMLNGLPVRAVPAPAQPTSMAAPPMPAVDVDTLALIAQVRDVFPDLGDGFLELCLKACKHQADNVIMALLEDALPAEVASLDRHMTTSDPAYVAMTTPKPTATVDKTQVWVGKKKQAATYKAESAKEDAATAAKTQALIMAYDEEPPLWMDAPTTNEYNDDYNDELEEYEPFGVHDDEPTDFEEIKARNKMVRAQEAEDAYWESMRNKNHATAVSTAEKGEDEAKPPTQGRRTTKAKNGAIVAEDKTASEDPKKQMINRARKEHNKAKVGNHHRKEGARRKQAKGMA
ncbi:hypothetical protein SPRG_19424 [Saprolegnia parasitica CBS 223.65]|uniref:CUE domain-containing protein n=1 Tax=Saprolegnia parasitica (strain CBS 223.65) TaxID=695850 RepID=A0A067D236_SAPPC|nr:hypothetical protein SPRG_19424 [Saprolegnia parasitica CBS 223.65]KDO32801.1 hypothetical protein SPRG_19424 [Saprolegnia parasitica CBS 223.65]|eukprot:XP_012196658.1 hypothetical protein SPRG_19424 [Saprolegnia parasitica CBS 223.65]